MRTPRNPDLPIVDELRAELRARLAADVSGQGQDAPQQTARRRAPERKPQRLGAARRVTRRSIVIVALLCLIAGVALAQLDSRGGGPPRHTAPTALGANGDWTISGYRDEARLCLVFSAEKAGITSDCGSTPPADGLRATSLVAAGRRFVAGIAGARVRRVSVRVGGRRVQVATRSPAHPHAARAAGVPPGLRWFVADLGVGAGSAPAHLAGLARANRPTGPGLLDCSLELVGESCRRAYEDRAYERIR